MTEGERQQGGPGEQRHQLLSTTRHVATVAVICAGLLAAFASAGWVRLCGLALGLLLLLLGPLLRRRWPVLVLDAEGYRVEAAGRVRLRVAWSEVRRVLHDPAEAALYVECGDPARNLLVPPAYGYGFTFSAREPLVARVLEAARGHGVPIDEVPDLRRAAQGEKTFSP